MSKKELETRLKKSLGTLEELAGKVVKSKGYTNEVRSIKLLNEMIKEQLSNENISHSTRKTG